VPAESALAVQTRSAQLQDKVEQQQLKRLVLDYEQREEAEELKGLFRCFSHTSVIIGLSG
jgi:regulator of nonsense transcripts 2